MTYLSTRTAALAWGTLALFAAPAFGQSNAGRNGAKFLSIGVGARETALGNAVTAIDGDAASAFWNPAGTALPSGQRFSVTLDHSQWFADLRHTSAAFGYNLGHNGTVTVGIQTFGATGIEANRQNGYADPDLVALVTDNNTSDTYDYLDLAASATYARSFGDRLSLGATAKVVNEAIDGESASAVAFDFGSLYNVGPMNWQLAARLSNLGTPIQFYNQANPLPLTFSIGSSFYPVNTEQARVMLSADALKLQDGNQRVNGGVEVSVYDLLFLRAGYKFGFANGAKNDSTSLRPAVRYSAENFSVGGGLQYRVAGYDLALDYAYTSMEYVDNVHRITLRLRR